MFVCSECGHLFQESKHYVETHGFNYGPYEEWDGCPYCSGAYTETYQCEGCGKWIADEYVKIDDNRYCSDCYEVFQLGEENDI